MEYVWLSVVTLVLLAGGDGVDGGVDTVVLVTVRAPEALLPE